MHGLLKLCRCLAHAGCDLDIISIVNGFVQIYAVLLGIGRGNVLYRSLMVHGRLLEALDIDLQVTGSQ